MVAIVNVILILIAVVMVVCGEPGFIRLPHSLQLRPAKLANCLLLGEPCMESKDPCCTLIYQKTQKRVGTVPTTCFKFGKGVCQVNHCIENFEEYSKLVKQLNDTNFQELKNRYLQRSSIPTAYTCPQKVIIEMNSE